MTMLYVPIKILHQNVSDYKYLRKVLSVFIGSINNSLKDIYMHQELETMREEAKAKNIPPRYYGKWATATKDEVDAELAKGMPYTYRFRVANEGTIKINDLIRGEVSLYRDKNYNFIY